MRLSYALGMSSSLAFFYFCLVFTSERKSPLWIQTTLATVGLAIVPILLYTNIMFSTTTWRGVIDLVGVQVWGASRGIIPFSFEIIFALFTASGIALIYKKMRRTKNFKTRKQFETMFWLLVVGFTPPGIFSLLLTSLDIHFYNWISPPAGIFWVSILAYSIMKYDQMNVRVAFTEILVLTGIFILFINIFI